MTFYEAAIEVLKGAERPLHYKKITELAIKKALLSHVGTTPEVTMGARLVQEVQHEERRSDIVRTRPGVFALRAWEGAGESSKNVDGMRLTKASSNSPNKVPASPILPKPEPKKSNGKAQEISVSTEASQRDQKPARIGQSEPQTTDDGPLSSADLYANQQIAPLDEEDDVKEAQQEALAADQQVLPLEAPAEDESAHQETVDSAATSTRRRRRRRTRRPESQGLEPAGKEDAEHMAPSGDAEEGAARDKQAKDGAHDLSGKPKVATATKQARSTAPEKSGDRRRGASMVPTVLRIMRDLSEPISGKDLARAIAEKTSESEKTVASIVAVLHTDNSVRRAQGRRPLFAVGADGRWALGEWSYERSTLRSEARLNEAVRQLRSQAIRDVSAKLSSLSFPAWEYVVGALLKQHGYTFYSSKAIAPDYALVHAEHQEGLTSVPVLVALHDVDELMPLHLTAMRDALSEEGARRGVLVTTGHVAQETLDECHTPGHALVSIIGRKQLARLLVEAGIGVQRQTVSVNFVDARYFEDLGHS